MAFSKFRLPGQTASTEALASGPSENIEVVRRRARHRLMGAVVLVSVAVVGFPLFFDTQPRPVSVDTPILIPDRQNTPPLASATPVPPEQAPAKPLLPAPDAMTAQASLDPREEVVASTAKTETAKEPPPVEKAPEKPAVAKQESKPIAPASPKENGNKAQALLEGKAAKPSAERVVIQVGAYSDASKVREVRNKLEQAGVKTYIQTVERDGKNTTRVRVGPYETKEEADQVAARIRKLDMPVVFLKF